MCCPAKIIAFHVYLSLALLSSTLAHSKLPLLNHPSLLLIRPKRSFVFSLKYWKLEYEKPLPHSTYC